MACCRNHIGFYSCLAIGNMDPSNAPVRIVPVVDNHSPSRNSADDSWQISCLHDILYRTTYQVPAENHHGTFAGVVFHL
jgi:hypothetical protein